MPLGDELTLAPASGQHLDAVRLLHHAEWGARLTPQQYHAREALLDATPFAARALRPFVLLRQRDPSGTGSPGAIVAYCEAYARPALLGAKQVTAWALASVFVPPEHRGRGFGSELIRRVVAQQRAEGVETGTLYSDIGVEYYARFGYVAQSGACDGVIDITPEEARNTPGVVSAGKSAFRLVKPDDGELDALIRNFNARRIAELTSSDFFIPLARDNVDWFRARSSFYQGVLGRAAPCGGACGAVAGGWFCVWFWDWKGEKLWLLVVDRVDDDDSGESSPAELLAAVERIARESGGVKQVRMYNPRAAGVPAAEEGVLARVRVVPRPTEISSLRVGGRAQANWVGDFKYLWV